MSKFLIVATPRAGTGYTAKLLENLGLNCGHERYFKVNAKLRRFLTREEPVGDCSWLGVPFIEQLPEDVKVLHQTRHPLKVIRSLLQMQLLDLNVLGQPLRRKPRGRFTEFALRHCPELAGCTTNLERAVWFYYHWNRKIDAQRAKREIMRYRVEDLNTELQRELLGFVGCDVGRFTDAELIARSAELPTNVNAKTNDKVMLVEDVSWSRLPGEVIELARSYGYEPDTLAVRTVGSPADSCDEVFESVRRQVYEAQLVWRSERQEREEQTSALQNEVSGLKTMIRELQERLRASEQTNQRAERGLAAAQALDEFASAGLAALDETVELLEAGKGDLNAALMRLRAKRCRRKFGHDKQPLRFIELLPEITRDFLREADRQMCAIQEKADATRQEACEQLTREHNETVARLKQQHAGTCEELRRSHAEAQKRLEQRYETAQRSHDQQVARLRTQHQQGSQRLHRALRAAETEAHKTKSTIDVLQSRFSRQKSQAEYMRASLVLRDEELRYRLGDALINSYYHPLELFRLPGRVVGLYREGLLRKRERREAERTEAALLASAGGGPAGGGGSTAVVAPALAEPKPESRPRPKPKSKRSSQPARDPGTSLLKSPELDFASPAAVRPQLPPRLPLKCGVVMDEFTYECFRDECHLIKVTPRDWRRVLSAARPDFLLVESTWQGNDGAWRNQVNRDEYKESDALPRLVEWCRSHQIPTAFWNKEDPPNFERFVTAAALFDHVFTTDQDCIPRYRERVKHDRIQALPFAAQPRIHNPIRSRQERIGNFCFAGTYYREKYPERRRDLEMLLRPAKSRGLTIFDRHHGFDTHKRYTFPSEYHEFVQGGLSYLDMVQAYKAYRVFLNINSVRESPTMFSRRVLELLACGTAVISTPSAGMEQMLGRDAVAIAETEEQAAEWMDKLIGDPELRERMVVRGQRRVFCEHTYEQRLRQIIKTLGLACQPAQRRVSVVTVTNRPGQLENVVANYQRQAYQDRELIIVLNNDSFSLPAVRETLAAGPNARVFQRPESATLGECLNHAIDQSSYEYIAKFDDDDYYGEHYLTDALNAFLYCEAEIVGKRCYYAYVQKQRCLAMRFDGYEHRQVKFVSGATLVVRRDLFEEHRFPEDVPRGVDTQFQRACTDSGIGIYSTDRFNFTANRLAATEGHTWQISDEEFLEKCRIVAHLDDYRARVSV